MSNLFEFTVDGLFKPNHTEISLTQCREGRENFEIFQRVEAEQRRKHDQHDHEEMQVETVIADKLQ